jgi:hypothetical protein
MLASRFGMYVWFRGCRSLPYVKLPIWSTVGKNTSATCPVDIFWMASAMFWKVVHW